MSKPALRALCEREHPELWRRYLLDGSVPSHDDMLAAEEADDSPLVDELLSDRDALDAESFVIGNDPFHTGTERDQDPPPDDCEPERGPRLHRVTNRAARRHRERARRDMTSDNDQG